MSLRYFVLAAFAQGRQLDGDRVEAVEQILAETACGHFVAQHGVGGRHQANVRLDGAGRTHALELARLDQAQQLGLLGEGHVADLVEEDRAAAGQFETAGAVRLCVGEGAFDVAEEFAFEEALGQAAHVDVDEGAAGARGLLVELAGDDTLARAVLAKDEDAGLRRRHLAQHLQHGRHGRRACDEAGEPGVGAQELVLLRQQAACAQGAAELAVLGHLRQDAAVVPRLLHKIARAAPHRLDGEVDGAPGRHQEHRQVGIELRQPPEQVQAFLAARGVARVVHVQQRHVELVPLHPAHRLLGRARHLHLPTLAFEEETG